MATTASYRLNTSNKNEDSSSEEGELSSDDDNYLQPCGGKRLKVSEDMDTAGHSSLPCTPPSGSNTQRGRRKPNNIWGSVLADQSSNDIANSIGVIGMKSYMSRGPESFSLELAIKEKNKYLELSSSDEEDLPVKPMKTGTIEEEMENYMIERHYMTQKNDSDITSVRSNGLKRKRTGIKKSKPGNVPKYQPGQRVTLNRKQEVTVDDSEDAVAEEITFRLWEKKKDLIRALVHTIGVEKSLLLYEKTETIELTGGILTLQGRRRRTPGGTFLHLLRNDDDVNQVAVNSILEADSLREREQRLIAKANKKQANEVPLDVGETPQNSPHMQTVHISNCDSNETAYEDEVTMDDVQHEQTPLASITREVDLDKVKNRFTDADF